MMDSGSEDDDIYPEHESTDPRRPQNEVKMEDMDDEEEEGEEVEDESDDDINFITDAKEEVKPDTGSQPKRPASVIHAQHDIRKASGTPQPTSNIIKSETTPRPERISTPQDGRSGNDYPARHTSTLDPMNGNPIHPATGKPILSTDLDSDFPADSAKPWRKPGADITDFFNYGFDEFTWASYCLKKQSVPQEIKQINQEAEQMKMFVEGIPGAGGMPGMPGAMAPVAPVGPGGNNAAAGNNGGMPGMPGMPSEAEMQQMFQGMMSQGIDPSNMDTNQFMQMMMGGGGGGGQGQFGQGQQPPQGPAAFGGGGGGFQQDGFGGGGGRGRGRGGRRNW